MRLSINDVSAIKSVSHEILGGTYPIRLFGSRRDESQKGGDVDLLIELPIAVEKPALLCAELSAKISRHLMGRKTDVLILAPNLTRLPIHEVALREGVPL